MQDFIIRLELKSLIVLLTRYDLIGSLGFTTFRSFIDSLRALWQGIFSNKLFQFNISRFLPFGIMSDKAKNKAFLFCRVKLLSLSQKAVSHNFLFSQSAPAVRKGNEGGERKVIGLGIPEAWVYYKETF